MCPQPDPLIAATPPDIRAARATVAFVIAQAYQALADSAAVTNPEPDEYGAVHCVSGDWLIKGPWMRDIWLGAAKAAQLEADGVLSRQRSPNGAAARTPADRP